MEMLYGTFKPTQEGNNNNREFSGNGIVPTARGNNNRDQPPNNMILSIGVN